MPILQVELPDSDFQQLAELAQSAGTKPEDLTAHILRSALRHGPTGAGMDDLETKRAIAGVCADRSPWNNEVDAEWDNWQP